MTSYARLCIAVSRVKIKYSIRKLLQDCALAQFSPLQLAVCIMYVRKHADSGAAAAARAKCQSVLLSTSFAW